MRSAWVLVLVLAVGGCHGDPTSAPTPSPPSGEQDGLLARPSANPAVVTEMIGREPPGVVLCAIDLLGHSEGEQYAWLMCGDYRTGPEAELLSASAEAVVIRGDTVEFPRQAHLDEDYDRMFPPDVARAIRYRDVALKPSDDELLALASAAAPAAAPSR
jgi:hypothetical protein